MENDDKTPRVVGEPALQEPARSTTDSEPEIPIPRPKKDWSYSATRDIVQQIMGPLARVRHKQGKDVTFSLEKGDKKIPFGWGDTFFDAVVNTFVKPVRHRKLMAAELEKLKAKELEAAVKEQAELKTPRVEGETGE